MKNINNILSKGGFNESAALFFENLAMESIKEITGEPGFLSEYEERNLLNSFNNKEAKKRFNEYDNNFFNIEIAIHKVLILQLQFETSAESYYWIRFAHFKKNKTLDEVNEIMFFQLNGILNNVNQSIKIPSRKLKIQDGFFEFNNDNDLDLSELLLSLKEIVLYKLKKVKSTIHAIQTYMDECNYNVQTHQKILKKIEDETVKRCENIDIDYSSIEVEESYSRWYRTYFLD